MKRIILDTQSNRLYRGIEFEQNYDQRGGLCQLGEGHVVVTTAPVEPDYLAYWRGLGFTLPHFIHAGPFDPGKTLSELVLEKPEVRRRIVAAAGEGPSRLEFFCIEASEEKVAEALGLPAYCNFPFSIATSRKTVFKTLCGELGIPTAPWLPADNRARALAWTAERLASGGELLLKADDGTGGIACGGILRIRTLADLETALAGAGTGPDHPALFIEEVIENPLAEISLHWEMDERGRVQVKGLFNQLSRNFSYAGVSYPATVCPDLRRQITRRLHRQLAPHMAERGAKGFFCCDIIVDRAGNDLWIDFNPRKGAIIYVRDMVARLSERHFGGAQCCFYHEHFKLPPGYPERRFDALSRRLTGLLDPAPRAFAVITNPGILRYGHVDITGVSPHTTAEAMASVLAVKERLTPGGTGARVPEAAAHPAPPSPLPPPMGGPAAKEGVTNLALDHTTAC